MPFYSLSSSGGSAGNSVVEAASVSAFPVTGAANTIYVARDTNVLYRWNSTAYVVVGSAKDEVIEGAAVSAFPATGEAGNLYIALDTGKAYRWTTGGYVEVSAAPVTSVAGRTGAISLTSSDVGLGNVNNTSDASKPVSTAQAAADSAVASAAANDATTKADAAKAYAIQRANHTGTQAISTVSGLQTALDSKQGSGSYATLDGGGKVPATLLPSYVDDVIEAASLSYLNANVTGETGKIYVTLDNNKTFRWSGSAYVEISASPGSTDAVTEGSVNLYFTNSRASAAAPVQQVAGKTGNVSITKSDVGLGNVDNTSDASKPVSTAQAAADSAVASSASTDATTKADAAKAYAIQRANHTGTQAISTVTGLQTALDAKAPIANAAFTTGITVSGQLNCLNGTISTRGGSFLISALSDGATLFSVSSSGTVTTGTWQATAVGVAYGGTGATTASDARANLGLGSLATQSSVAYSSLIGTPTAFTPASHTHAASDIAYTGNGPSIDAANVQAAISQIDYLLDNFITGDQFNTIYATATTGGTVKIGSGVTITNGVISVSTAYAASSHTHDLSSLTQSSATTGQVPQWSGTAWVAATPSASVSYATTAQAQDLTATTVAMNPDNVRRAITAWRQVAYQIGYTANGASTTNLNTQSQLQTSSSVASSSASLYVGAGTYSLATYSSSANWTRPIALFARVYRQVCPTNGVFRYLFGTLAGGGYAYETLSNRGIGFEIRQTRLWIICHNGTSLTQYDTGIDGVSTDYSGTATEVLLRSDGSGTVTMTVSVAGASAQTASTTGGPTTQGNSTQASYAYAAVTNGASTTQAWFWFTPHLLYLPP